VPKPIIDKLYGDVARVLAQPAVAAQIREAGSTPVGNSPEQAAAFFAAERTKWTAVITTAKITGD
jgi:tripartite-type tricarboxylate transporter receptor subunit TctC